VDYPQDTYCPSESATFHVITNNSESFLPITAIKCDFSYNLRIKGNYGDSYLVGENLITQKEIVNIPAGSSEMLKPVEFCLKFDQVREKLEKMFSTKGTLIECFYWNKIEAEVDGNCMCCGEYPMVKSAINIVPSVRILETLPQKPNGWDPKMMDVVHLEFNEKFDVPYEKKDQDLKKENFNDDEN
jgi:hypothetical protein